LLQQQLAQVRQELASRDLQLVEMRSAHLKYAAQSKASQEKWERAVAERDELLVHKDQNCKQYARRIAVCSSPYPHSISNILDHN
jgi:hypothetical protein